jgi:hypothetical protein
MPETASSMLAAWASFYVIIGSSAGALTGLMFVVITLVAGKGSQTTEEGVTTFSTPTVVHFCAALFVSAILSVPWHSLGQAGVAVGLGGAGGLVFVVRAIIRTSRLTTYRADMEDWIWYTALPGVAYVAIVAGAIALQLVPAGALFVLAGAALLLIFVGIHNAWDMVTYIALNVVGAPPPAKPPAVDEAGAPI